MTKRWEIDDVVYAFEEDVDTLSLVIGKFDGFPALGMHWKKHNKNAPIVLAKQVETILLTGLLQQAILQGDLNQIDKLVEVIQKLNGTSDKQV